VEAIASSYILSIFDPAIFKDFGPWAGVLTGSVSAFVFMGYFLVRHFKMEAVPKDLFTGPMSGDKASLFRGSMATTLAFSGAGLGFILSDFIFRISSLGIGTFLLMPGLFGSALIVQLWKLRKDK
jgi:lipid-A-disaccharide synthase-like uncharacterized protein